MLIPALPNLTRAEMMSEPFVPAQGSASPANGDLNPYGLAIVPAGFPGKTLQAGQLLVSNFNNGAAGGNIQGQGTTIVTIDPNTGRQLGVFFQGTMPIGFTNALGIVPEGFVFAGSVFTTGSGTNVSPAQNGGLLVLDSNGNLVKTVMTGVNGPWGLAINQRRGSAQVFVSNVLDGTVTRLEVSFEHGFSIADAPITIGSGYSFGPDSAGLVVGPAGLAFDSRHDILYVASEGDNEIFAIPHASTADTSSGQGMLVFSDSTHLHGPLGLMIAPNGDLVTANADPAAHVDPAQPSELVEFTTQGRFVRQFSIDPNNGSAFAILNVSSERVNQFAYVDDFSSIVNILRLSNR
ncbi:MAG: YncE family protein [Candidatus Binataceae bacterium]